jgi:glycosyltransferase involved in cell wall biosynthesis
VVNEKIMTNQTEVVIVMPVFNDWPSMERLVKDIDIVLADSGILVRVVAVDDSSTVPAPDLWFENMRAVRKVQVIHLGGNVGHQRAIATGLSWLVSKGSSALVAVMDSDGEDQPTELKRLLAEAANAPDSVIAAQRARRSESTHFKLFYKIYRMLFYQLTGKSISFGNFLVLPPRWVVRLVHDPNIWNNLAATIIDSRLPIHYVPTTRGTRYFGQSKMNFVSLVAHGLGAISVFSESVFIRVCIASLILLLGSIGGGAAAVFIRLFTDFAIPGWTTNAIGIALLISIQAVLMPIMMAFLLLSNRSSIQTLPKDHALKLIMSVTDVRVDQETLARTEGVR